MASFWAAVDDMAEALDAFLESEAQAEDEEEVVEMPSVFQATHEALGERGRRLHNLETRMDDMRARSSETAKLSRELSTEVNSARYYPDRSCLCC